MGDYLIGKTTVMGKMIDAMAFILLPGPDAVIGCDKNAILTCQQSSIDVCNFSKILTDYPIYFVFSPMPDTLAIGGDQCLAISTKPDIGHRTFQCVDIQVFRMCIQIEDLNISIFISGPESTHQIFTYGSYTTSLPIHTLNKIIPHAIRKK